MHALYARMLRLYPASFRTRFSKELLQMARDRARFDGRRVWPGVFADLFGSALIQRGRDRKMRTKLAVAMFVAIAVVGGTTLAIGTTILSLSGLLVATAFLSATAVVYGLASLVARGRNLGAEHDYATGAKRWWWVPAGSLGAFQLLFMAGQLISDPKIENVFALLLIGAFSALVFGGMFVRNRRTGNWMIATGVLPMLPFFWIVVPTIVSLLVIVMALSDNIRTARVSSAATA